MSSSHRDTPIDLSKLNAIYQPGDKLKALEQFKNADQVFLLDDCTVMPFATVLGLGELPVLEEIPKIRPLVNTCQHKITRIVKEQNSAGDEMVYIRRICVSCNKFL